MKAHAYADPDGLRGHQALLPDRGGRGRQRLEREGAHRYYYTSYYRTSYYEYYTTITVIYSS